MIALKLIVGLVVLLGGAELFVRGASALARALGISALVIGLTVVAFGTSAPEMAVGVRAAIGDQAGIVLGNVIGSNICNVLLILGLSALIVPLSVSSQLVRLDVPVMIGVSVLVWVFAADGALLRWEGAVLVVAVVMYTALLIRIGKVKPEAGVERRGDGETGRRGEVKGEGDSPHFTGDASRTGQVVPSEMGTVPALGLVVAGLGLLVAGGQLFVSGAVEMAVRLGVSERVIGLTIVALGTSLPEVATSIVAAIRGERDIAVGNVVGSNIMNLLAILGVSTVIAGDVAVDAATARFDVPVMVAVAVVCLPIFFTGGRVSRGEGGLLLFYYVSYIVYVVVAAIEEQWLMALTRVVWAFALPLSVLGILLSVYYALREKRLPK